MFSGHSGVGKSTLVNAIEPKLQLKTKVISEQHAQGQLEGHRQWIGFLLQEYYDPMYEYQFEQRAGELLFRGDRKAVLAWANSR